MRNCNGLECAPIDARENMQFVKDRTPDGQRMERWPASILNERIGNGKSSMGYAEDRGEQVCTLLEFPLRAP